MNERLGGLARLAAALALAATASATLTLAHPDRAAADTHCTTSGDETLCAVDITAQPGTEFSGGIGTDSFDDPFGGVCFAVGIDSETVDWGDGSVQSAGSVCTSDSGVATVTLSGTHVYAAAGTYTVTLTSTVHSIDLPVAATATATVGSATSPATIGLAPMTIDFGTHPVGVISTSQTITVSNTAAAGAESLQLGSITIGGANPSDFGLVNDTCSNESISAGSSCTIGVTFTPAQSGTRAATVSVPSNAAGSPSIVPLTGNGATAPSADVKVSISGPSSARRGAQVSYVITIANAGPSTAHNVVMNDPTPSGASFIGASVSRGTCTVNKAGRIGCAVGDLSMGSTSGSVVSVKVTAKIGSTISNLASAYSTADAAGSATSDPDTSNNWASVTTAVTK